MRNRRNKFGFTLVELLVVIAIISLLLATLLPALGAAKRQARCVTCQSQLRNIAIAWKAYFYDNDDLFYQGRNANHNFGGWKGKGGYGQKRPLNHYLGMPLKVPTEEGADKFCCPADIGGVIGQPPEQPAFNYFGNSYQTNIFMIGPNKVGAPGMGKYQDLHKEVNKRLKRLRHTSVDEPHRLLLVGDNNWLNKWHPFFPEAFLPKNMAWHGPEDAYNMAYLDGRVDLVVIERGVYVQEKGYRILPFKDLDYLAFEIQK